MRVITDSWVKVARLPPPTQWRNTGRQAWRDCVGAARLRASLRPHSGGTQVAIARAKTRPSSLPQAQYGGFHLRVLVVHTLLARGGNDRSAQRAMRHQAAGIAHQVRTRQRHDGGQRSGGLFSCVFSVVLYVRRGVRRWILI